MTQMSSWSRGSTPPRTRRPRPGDSIVASAQRLTSQRIQSRQSQKSPSWQTDALDAYDLVGEVHFLGSTLANRLAQARFYVGRLPDNPTDDPVPLDEGDRPDISAVLDSVGATAAARTQLIQRLAVNLFVAGEGWLVGIPRH